MSHNHFVPFHINATAEDLCGNAGIGRYIFLPGSDGRAKQISQHFNHMRTINNARGHHLYLGSIDCNGIAIDVAAIASGMGCPSMEIILHELFHLGAKRFLRVGSAGSLQPDMVKLGDYVHASAAVRDEGTTNDYVPLTVPAISSFEFTANIISAAKILGLEHQLHTGIVHCKSSFYAREFGAGPKGGEHLEFNDLLTECGVLASEMETASLFIQSQLYHHQLRKQGSGAQFKVLAGAILGILAMPPHTLATAEHISTIEKNLILLSLETIKALAAMELLPS